MFGWLFGKGKNHQAEQKAKTSANKAPRKPQEAGDSVFPDFAHEPGQTPNALEAASNRAMEQRREQRRADRMGRREALFGIVREVMLRSGILSSAYKFKVLSIDQKGRHFLVLLDLSMELAQSEPTERLLEIERMIADTSMSRMQVVVQAVYWRHFVAGQAATVRLSSGDTQPGGLSTSVTMNSNANAQKEKQKPTDENKPQENNSPSDAISAALADLRAKNRAKTQERVNEQATSGAAQGAGADFAATQVFNRAALAAGASASADTFPATRMQISSAEADAAELAAFQRALQGSPSAPSFIDDNPASIFVSGKAIDTHKDSGPVGLEEQFVDGGIDLSGTQYGELPRF